MKKGYGELCESDKIKFASSCVFDLVDRKILTLKGVVWSIENVGKGSKTFSLDDYASLENFM